LSALIFLGLYPLFRYLWVDSKYRAALAAADRRDFKTARDNLDVCIREWPNSAEVRFQAARSARRAGDFEAAALLLRDAKRLGWVAEAVELEEVLAIVQQRQYQRFAVELLNLVHRGHPDSVLILEALTPAALADLELDIAWQCLDPWLERAPNDERPRLMKGELLERFRNRNGAIALYREAVRLAPDNPEARLRCGWLAHEMRSTAEAAEHFDWLFRRQPQDPEVRRGLAKVRQAQGQSDEARALLDGLLKEYPDDVQVLAARGEIELEASNPKLAERWLRPAAAGANGDPRILYQWALCLEQQNRPKESAEALQRFHHAEEDHKKLAELRQELVSHSRDPGIRLQIGQIMMRNGLEREGRRWLETALRQDPWHVPTHQALADHYERNGNRELAENHRRIVREVEKQEADKKKKTP
jgi:predicted Zn-dependent protease